MQITSVLQLRVDEMKRLLRNRNAEIDLVESRIQGARQTHEACINELQSKLDLANRALADLRSMNADTRSPEQVIKNLETSREQLIDKFNSDLTLSKDRLLLDELRSSQDIDKARLKKLAALLETADALRLDHSKDDRAGIPEPHSFPRSEDASGYVASRVILVLFIEDSGLISSGAIALPSGAIKDFAITRAHPLKVQFVPDSLGWVRRLKVYSHLPVQSELVFSHPYLTARPAAFRETVQHSSGHLTAYLESDNDALVRAIFTESDNELYVSNPSEVPRTKVLREHVSDGYHLKEVKQITVAHADLSNCLSAIDSLIEPFVRPSYDLDQSEADLGPIGIRVKAAADAIACNDGTFVVGQGRLTEKEIWDRIGPYWDAMILAPWEQRIFGTFALLKHLCKNRREVVSFWSLETHGHFAFRVRTPDHNWLRGEVFCPAAKSTQIAVPSDADVTVLVPRDRHVITVGPCLIAICIEPSSE